MYSLENKTVYVSLQHVIHKEKSFFLVKIVVTDNNHFVMFHTDIADLFQMDCCNWVPHIGFQYCYQTGILGNQASGGCVWAEMEFFDACHNSLLQLWAYGFGIIHNPGYGRYGYASVSGYIFDRYFHFFTVLSSIL